jgi:integrase
MTVRSASVRNDLGDRVSLTAGRIDALVCPSGQNQAFLRDSEVPGLRVRVTSGGAKAFVFESKLNRQNIRVTIGNVQHWRIPDARAEARKLAVLVDSGRDPREVGKQQALDLQIRQQAELLNQAQQLAEAVTFGEAWQNYLADRRPFWGDRHFADHEMMAKPGGMPTKRGVKANDDGSKPLTRPGPVYELLRLPLKDVTPSVIEGWAALHSKDRATYARLCWRCIKAFMNWCAESECYGPLMPIANPAKTKRAREVLGKPQAKNDSLQKEQLRSWFSAVMNIQNPTLSAYLQVLLLTGARPGEVLTVRWEDVDAKWKGITIRDKVDGVRVIPLTPYVARLLAGLPKHNQWVFSSTRALKMDEKNMLRRRRGAEAMGRSADAEAIVSVSVSGHLADPSAAHRCACASAGLDGLTLHGLRRSFASLTEWLDVPAGVVAQIQGHKPSATAERHYKRRPLDLLRVHHERIESWILNEAGVAQSVATPLPTLTSDA